MPERKSPTQSAASSIVGTVRKGNDGKQWVVAITSAGIRRWVRVPPVSADGKTRSRPVSAISSNKTVANRKTHTVLFCEPSTFWAPVRRGCVRRPPRGVKITVSSSFYATLLRAPKKYYSSSGGSNAYVFGPKKALSSYKHLGYHGNDVAQVGFVDLDLFVDEPEEFTAGVLDREFKASHYHWDERAPLRRARVQIPHVLWLGETSGGDVGADLYAHYTRGRLDGLIVDNDYFFASSNNIAPRPSK